MGIHEFSGEELETVPEDPTGNITVDRIVRAVSVATGIKESRLLGSRRFKSDAFARHVAMYFAKKFTPKSYPEIGRMFGRDHTTVMSGVSKIRTMRNAHPDVRRVLERIEIELLK